MALNTKIPRESNLRWFRSLAELAASFVIAVILLRGLVLEGYLISTGSMAPGLLGYHKRVKCPECQCLFAFGVSFDESVDSDTLAAADADVSDNYATCPNCGQTHIDVSHVPRNHGDQLLVHKHVFDLRRPNRWERVVFRNPADPGECYVKRVVGLPNETIRIVDGDLYISGQIARKSYETQLDMRIPVFDLRYVPDSDDWHLPWQMTENWKFENESLVSENSKTASSDKDGGDTASAESWLRFRHWRWFGGNHAVEVPLAASDALADWNAFLQRFDRIPVSWAARIEYERSAQLLRCHGVMPPEMQRDLISNATNPAFQTAVYRLAALSHVAPATDRYGYNSKVSSSEFPVRDLFLTTRLSWTQPPEMIRVDVPVMNEVYQLHLDVRAGAVVLVSDTSRQAVRKGHFDLPTASESGDTASLTLEASNFDRRVVIAINGKQPFEPVDLPATVEQAESIQDQPSLVESLSTSDVRGQEVANQQNRLALGFIGGVIRIENLQVFRDVYYTPGRRKNAVEAEFTVPVDSYFVHGDNSPVSSDSRSWEKPCVPHHLLVGKPFLVHLPSMPGRLRIGGREVSIRIPDFGRIRYIR